MWCPVSGGSVPCRIKRETKSCGTARSPRAPVRWQGKTAQFLACVTARGVSCVLCVQDGVSETLAQSLSRAPLRQDVLMQTNIQFEYPLDCILQRILRKYVDKFTIVKLFRKRTHIQGQQYCLSALVQGSTGSLLR